MAAVTMRQRGAADRERFYAKTVRAANGCLEWTASTVGRNGYGGFKLQGRVMGAHRAAWILETGEKLTSEQHILHSCDNNLCVDITHLRVGTIQDNADDRVARDRVNIQRGEAHHRTKFSDEDVEKIRRLAAEGMPRKDIAVLIGSSYGYVRDVLFGRCRSKPTRESVTSRTKELTRASLAKTASNSVRRSEIRDVVHPSDEIPGEEWRQTRYEGYWVSSLGRVRGKRGTILRPWSSKHGHLAVQCGSHGKFGIHVLVCEAWHGARPEGMWAGHRDGVPTNNVPGNLRWVTPHENSADMVLHGKSRSATGEHFNSKLTWTQVREIRASFPAPRGIVKTLAARYGVSRASIIYIRDGKGWIEPQTAPGPADCATAQPRT